MKHLPSKYKHLLPGVILWGVGQYTQPDSNQPAAFAWIGLIARHERIRRQEINPKGKSKQNTLPPCTPSPTGTVRVVQDPKPSPDVCSMALQKHEKIKVDFVLCLKTTQKHWLFGILTIEVQGIQSAPEMGFSGGGKPTHLSSRNCSMPKPSSPKTSKST